jgi:hypothetical protein
MSFLDNLFSQYGQAGQYASDRMNGKNQTMPQREWSPSDPSQMLDQVQQPMPSGIPQQMNSSLMPGQDTSQPNPTSLMGQMSGGMGGPAGLPPTDNSGQPTPSSLMGQMSQGITPQMQTPVAAPESQPVADYAPAQYGDLVKAQEDKNKPMDMGSMMQLLQGGLGSYTATPTQGTGEKGIIGKAFQSYVSGLAGKAGGK